MAANASVQVDAADPFGILITNGEFTSFVSPDFGQQVYIHSYTTSGGLLMYIHVLLLQIQSSIAYPSVCRFNSSACDIF